MHGLLKFITCGSVDDGKSTLIGHMLYDAKLIYADQENALKLDSKVGSAGEEMDFSLLLDGLSAEREQGITIDVAYRFFHTEARSMIVADCPGHEEYSRNMAVGASFADLAVILVDASKGVLLQTRRHARICSLMGIKHFVFALNKMDLMGYQLEVFQQVAQEIQDLMAEIPSSTLQIIPVSAKVGDNVSLSSKNMLWYTGETLLSYLETVDISSSFHHLNALEVEAPSFLLPIQRVSRPDLHFRGFQGQVAEGQIKKGDLVQILPSGEEAQVTSLFHGDKEVEELFQGQGVTITLDREVDCSRGCVITSLPSTQTSLSSQTNQTSHPQLEMTRLFRAKLLWMDEEPLVVGRNHLLKLGTKLVPATILKIHHCVDVNTGKDIPLKQGKKNDIISCDLSLSEKVVLSSFEKHPDLGRFILINRVTHATAGCGVVVHSLSRSDNLSYQNTEITPEIRQNALNQVPKTIWFTGLSGSGKSTLANELEKQLVALGKHTMLLDGDNIRMGLCHNLGFTEEDRVENIRRIAEVCKLMNQAGLIVLVSVISPFASDRQNAKSIIGDGFFQVFVETSLEVCEKRDTKGLYQKARQGKIPNFTGISAPYETPTHPDFIASTEGKTPEELVADILHLILK